MIKEPIRGQYDYLLRGFPIRDEGPIIPPPREPERRVTHIIIDIQPVRRSKPPTPPWMKVIVAIILYVTLALLLTP